VKYLRLVFVFARRFVVKIRRRVAARGKGKIALLQISARPPGRQKRASTVSRPLAPANMPLAPTFALSGVTSYAPPALARAMPPRDAFFAIPSASEKGEPMKMFDLRKMAREAGVLDAIDGAMEAVMDFARSMSLPVESTRQKLEAFNRETALLVEQVQQRDSLRNSLAVYAMFLAGVTTGVVVYAYGPKKVKSALRTFGAEARTRIEDAVEALRRIDFAGARDALLAFATAFLARAETLAKAGVDVAAAGLEKVKALVDEITKKLGKKDDDDGKK